MHTVLIILSCILSQFADEKELIYLEIEERIMGKKYKL